MKKHILIGVILSIFLGSTSVALEPPWPSYLVVGNKGDNTVSFINKNTGREVAVRPVSDSAPHEIAVAPYGTDIAVVNYGGSSIDIFSMPGMIFSGTIDLGENINPHGILWLDNGNIVATTEGSQSIVVISGNGPFSERPVQSISTQQKGTHMVAVSEDNAFAYTANMISGTISKIDLNAGKTTISVPAGKEVEGIALAKNDSEVWASVRGEHKVSVFDSITMRKLADIEVGEFPLRIITHPNGEKMVTSNLLDGTVSVIDVKTRKVERTINVSGTADSRQVTLLFSQDGSRLYAAETGNNKIAEIDFEYGYVVGRLAAGSQGDGLAIVPASPW